VKVLFINNFKGVDYLNDCLFHGGRSLYGDELVDSTFARYMYTSYPQQDRLNLYGKGFNIAGKLPEPASLDRTDLVNKIQDKVFDIVVYGSVHRNLDYLEHVLKVYSKDRIVFVDGEDELEVVGDLVGKGVYFKRELTYAREGIHPIGFAIPKSQIIQKDVIVQKEKTVAMSSHYEIGYTFSCEKEYNEEYQKSYFGLTQKKAGWDCMRHYEIVANGALPVFKDYKEIPTGTMTLWDKKLIEKSYELFWNFRPNRHENLKQYEELREEMLDMVSTKLTTESLFKYVIGKL
jgi:hypothetical protein